MRNHIKKMLVVAGVAATDLLFSSYSHAAVIAQDGFDDGSFSDATAAPGNGTGWKTNTWAIFGSNVAVQQGSSQSGGNAAILPNTSEKYIERSVDLSRHTALKVTFFSAHAFLEGGETLLVKYDNGGGTYSTIGTVTGTAQTGSGTSTFTFREFALGATSGTTTTQRIRFETGSSPAFDTSDRYFVDTIQITGNLVPEPTTAAMLLGGTGLLMLLRRRRH